MVPKLTPEEECTQIPQEVCNLSYGPPKIVMKPFKAEWCLDETEVDQDLEQDQLEQDQLEQDQPLEEVEAITDIEVQSRERERQVRRGRNRRLRNGRQRRPLSVYGISAQE